MSTTHLGRAQSDILYQILTHLAVDLHVPNHERTRESKTVSQTLARLARVHTSFTRPALAFLWRSLPNLKVLEGLLCVLGIATRPPPPPKDILCVPQLEMCGTLADHESAWARFQEYASLVRELAICPFVGTRGMDATILQDTFWSRLVPALENSTILPRLESASLYYQSCVFDTGVLRLLNPSLRELHIVLPYLGAEQHSTLRSALSACFSTVRDLEVLCIRVQTPTIDIDSLPRLYPRLRQLKLLGSMSIDHSHLTTLASLPTLEHLSISLDHRELLNGPIRFGGLQNIRIFAFELPAVGALIAHMDAPHLRAFSFSEWSEEYDKLTGHLRTLATKCPSLTTFQWSCGARPGSAGRRRINEPLVEFIRPLLSLRALRNFTLAADFTLLFVPYTPSDFLALAKAWPDLETFRFSDRCPRRVEHYVDLEALVSFARHCPRLRTLHLPVFKFDAETDTSVDAVESPPARWLEALTVEYIIYPGLESTDETRRALELLRDRMRDMFPSATLQFHRIPKASDYISNWT